MNRNVSQSSRLARRVDGAFPSGPKPVVARLTGPTVDQLGDRDVAGDGRGGMKTSPRRTEARAGQMVPDNRILPADVNRPVYTTPWGSWK